MDKLISGIHCFQTKVFNHKKTLFERLANGQHPEALFITCSDSRVDPCLLTQTDPGELFVMRNAGNIVPPYGASTGGESATVEFAVSVLGVKHIIVCGHNQCGAMGGLLYPNTISEMPAVRSWLCHAESVSRIMGNNSDDTWDQQAHLDAAVKVNVVTQLDNLRTHPSVAVAVNTGALQLHGWVYNFETAEVAAYDPARKEFLPLRHAISPEAPT